MPPVARLLRLFRITSSVTAVVLLVVFNLVPLAGVLWWGWNVYALLILYWLENGIIGAINVAKIRRAEGTAGSGVATFRMSGQATQSKAAMVGFFVMHYGIFWAVHGIFVFTLPLFLGLGSVAADVGDGLTPTVRPDGSVALDGLFPSVDAGLRWDVIVVGGIGLAISHVASYFLNFVGRGEYRRVSPAAQTMAPYGRLLVLHMTIILGALFSGFAGSPVGAVAVLVVAKTVLDLVLHVAEHRRAGGGAVLTA
jgi:hypothetical protein